MLVLVTGADGQLGSQIVRFCEDNQIAVTPLTRQSVDLEDKHALVKFILDTKPTHIIHCAAKTNVDDCESNIAEAYAVNATSTQAIVGAAEQIGAHVTYISTDYVFAGDNPDGYRELDEPNPLNEYGKSKLAGEQALRKTDAVVRVSWLFSKNGKNIINNILGIIPAVNVLSFVDDQTGNPTFTEDAVPVIMKISTESRQGIWHVTNQGTVSWYKFISDAVEASGIGNVKVLPIKSSKLKPKRPAVRPKYSQLVDTRLAQEGLEPLPHYTDALKRFFLPN